MVTFFAIILIVLVINVALIFFSNSNSSAKVKKVSKGISKQTPPKIYPLDMDTSKYKKAI